MGAENDNRKLTIKTITSKTGARAAQTGFSPAFMEAYEVASYFGTNVTNGLTKHQVKRSRLKHGSNTVIPEFAKSIASSIKSQLLNVAELLLVASLLCYGAFTGNEGTYFAAVAVVLVVCCCAFMEKRAADSLNEIARFGAQNVTVIRDGRTVSVKEKALVPGDVILLENGSVVPADARLIEVGGHLFVLETPLNGVEVSVEKSAVYVAKSEKDEAYNMVFAGTIVTSGSGVAIVCHTGADTKMGKRFPEAESRLPRRLCSLTETSKRISFITYVACFVLMLISTLFGGDLVHAYMLAVAVCATTLHNVFGVLCFASFADGIKQMAEDGAVIKRYSAVDKLCRVNSVMCDKATAFPLSEMNAELVYINDRHYKVNEENKQKISKIFTYALLCSDTKRNGSSKNKDARDFIGNPADVAMACALDRIGIDIDSFKESHFRIEADPEPKGGVTRALVLHNDRNVLILRGNPEHIVRLCAGYEADGINKRFDEASKRRILEAAADMGDASQHVIAVASATTEADSLRASLTAERRLVLNGFIGLYTSLELNSANAVYKCNAGGIETVLKSPDAYVTAVAGAKDAGILKSEEQVISGEEIRAMDRGLYIADSPKYKLYLHVSEEEWADVLRLRKADGRVTAATVENTEEIPLMRDADVCFASEANTPETVKYAADVLVLKGGLNSICNSLQKARMINKRILAAFEQTVATQLTFLVCFAVSAFLGLSCPFRATDAVICGVLFGSVYTAAAVFAPCDRKILEDRTDYGKKNVPIENLIAPALFSFGGTICIYINFLVGKRLTDVDERLYSMSLVCMAAVLLVYLCVGVEKRSVIFSSALKNRFILLAVGAVCAVTAMMLYVPRFSGAFGFAPIGGRLVLTALLCPISLFVVLQIALFVRELVKKPAKTETVAESSDFEQHKKL